MTAFKFQFGEGGWAAESETWEDSNKEGSSATEHTNIFFHTSVFTTTVPWTG